jgi:hypothetical protein
VRDASSFCARDAGEHRIGATVSVLVIVRGLFAESPQP